MRTIPLSPTNSQGIPTWTQTFSYDAAGRMRTNSQVGTYAYQNPTVANPAPSTVTPASGPVQTLTYDANGNMTPGFDARVMTYDGENRPLSVSYAGKQTCYVYGADGARLKKLEGYTGANCATPGASATVTAYLNGAEVRAFGQGAAEVLVLYPSPEVRLVKKLVSGSVVTEKTFLHHDGLGSVRAVTGAAGTKTETSSYRPFGEQSEAAYALNTPEAKGYIGERFDADAGLQYLNARYYDPRLGMFLQPDWWEVTQAGVGTNRYSYSFNDPVNGKDVSGHDSFGVGAPGKDGKYHHVDKNGVQKYVGGYRYNTKTGRTAYMPQNDMRKIGKSVTFKVNTSVIIGYHPVVNTPITGTQNYHSFISIYDKRPATIGKTNTYRAGPSMAGPSSPASGVLSDSAGSAPDGWGDVSAVTGEKAEAIEWGQEKPKKTEIVIETDATFEEVDEEINDFAKKLNESHTRYSPLHANSNTFTAEAIKSIGFGNFRPSLNVPAYDGSFDFGVEQ